MRKPYHIYLEERDYKRLIAKANEVGFKGRGCVSKFLSYLSSQNIVFLDKNAQAVLKAFVDNT